MNDPENRPATTPLSGGFEFNRPTIIGLLFLAASFTGVTAIIGVILCYVWRGEPHEPWEATHYTYLIRTFWIAFILSAIGTVLMIVLIGFPILFATGVWALARIVIALINAQKRSPMPNPETLFF